MRTITTVALLTLLAAAMPAVGARSSHGHGGGHSHGMHASGANHGRGFAGDNRHAGDAYTNAASDEEDRLLNSKLKSICRGC